MELSEEDVLHILKLIDESKFDYFQLEVGDLKITVSKGEPIPITSGPQQASASQPLSSSALEQGSVSQKTMAGASQAGKPARPAAEQEEPKAPRVADGLVPVTAPLLGTFYVAPEPGAPPFVQVGNAVTEDTTVGLIEVMKVFNSVRANVSGVIAEVVAQNGQFVEYGQTLFLVRP